MVRVIVVALVAEVVALNVPVSLLLTSPQLTRNVKIANISPMCIVKKTFSLFFFRRNPNGKKIADSTMAAEVTEPVVTGTVSPHVSVITYVPLGVVEEVATVNVPED